MIDKDWRPSDGQKLDAWNVTELEFVQQQILDVFGPGTDVKGQLGLYLRLVFLQEIDKIERQLAKGSIVGELKRELFNKKQGKLEFLISLQKDDLSLNAKLKNLIDKKKAARAQVDEPLTPRHRPRAVGGRLRRA